jgi:hypothetical protein
MKKVLIIVAFAVAISSCAKKKEEPLTELVEKREAKAEQSPVPVVENEMKVQEEEAVEVKEEEPVEAIKEAEPAASALTNLSISDLWAEYKKARQNAYRLSEIGELSGVVEDLLVAGECAELLKRPDIASWQYNNAGKYTINIFRKTTEYDTRMNQINRMRAGDAKKQYVSESKKVMNDHLNIINQGMTHLEKAKRLDAIQNDKKRLEKIESNMQFISEVKRFLGGVS